MGPYAPRPSSNSSWISTGDPSHFEKWLIGLGALTLITIVACMMMVIAIVG